MTTPDPAQGSTPVPDDATAAFDPGPGPGVAGGPPPFPSDTWAPQPLPSDTWAPPPGPAPAGTMTPPPGQVPPAPGSLPPGAVPPSWGWQGAPPPAAARRSTPPGLVAGVVLVVIGAALLVTRVVEVSFGGVTWPLWIVVPGVAMLVGSFFIPPRGGLGLAIPGAIVTMIGLVLWVQAVYGLYATWAYAWALVAPTAPGLGMLLYGLVHRDGELVGDGLRVTLVGIGLFLGFALFFEGVIGLSGDPMPNLDQVLPYGIVALGVLLVVLSLFGNGGRRGEARDPR